MAARTIERIQFKFAAYGLPETMAADNYLQFWSKELKTYCKSMAIDLQLIPLTRWDGTLLSLQSSIDKWLFCYRNTPHTSTGRSPAELFLKQKPQTKLQLLKPMLPEYAARHRVLRGDMRRMGFTGEQVLVQCVRGEKTLWVPGEVIESRGSNQRECKGDVYIPITRRKAKDREYGQDGKRRIGRMKGALEGSEGIQKQMGETLEGSKNLGMARVQEVKHI
ncbi:hypothetical protein PR048_021601 [Dryococelus australis]|uniref:Integrase catalytic domain-containing protein n=1 Tax=Dryococelus australis TaxID=614101 RepID=A0ABQ9GYU0_9NEOP|nr:hypothetical protein PR048_021601 [Dryococelus australis]